MDPLSISFGVAGVLPLIAKVIATAHQYVNAVAGAKKMISSLIMELEVLQSAINKLGDLLLTETLAESDVKFDQSSVLLSCSAAIEMKLQELFRKLVKETNKKLGSLLWPFTEKEHQKTIGELRIFSTWIQFALSVDGCRLLSQTSDNLVAVLSQQLDQFKVIRQLDAKTTEMFGAVQKQTKVLQDGAELEHRKIVLDWISTAKHDGRHSILQQARAKNTGSWLLRSNCFTHWRDGLSTSKVLWCSGIPGSGKTILASTAIDELRSRFANLNAPLAYYYFDYQDHKSQSPTMIVSSLLKQLLEQLPELPVSVKDSYDARSKSEGNLLTEYERLLEEITQASNATYMVFDALDECENLKYMLQLIETLSQVDNCRILVTSRPHVYEQLSPSRSYSKLEIEAQEEDIKAYVLEQCDAANISQIADDKFVDQLLGKLVFSASGMFLLPVLQLRTVLNEPTIGEMEDKLEQLTDGLADAFEETFARIQRLPGSRSRLALSALLHLAHAKRLFQASELSDLLGLRPDSTVMNTKYRPTAKMILDCCQGLATLDEQTGQLRLAHYAIQEYLVFNSEILFPQFEVRLAFDCLNYMLLDDFKTGPLKTSEGIDSRLASYPFISYCAEFWGSFVKPVETNPDVWNKLLSLYGSLRAAAAAFQIRYYEKGYHQGYYGVAECLSTTPLHHSVFNGLERSTRTLLEHFDVNEASRMGTTPVIKAASNGHVSVTKLLLERGADPRISNWYGDALQCAAEAGECGTIRLLVEWGMNPNGEDNDGRSPLSCALDHDHAQAVELLVDLGADLRLYEDDEHVNTFLEACHMSSERTVDVMLKRGWIDLRSGNEAGMALCAATLPMLRHLISIGVDVNMVDKRGHTALWYATVAGNEKYIRVLREAGATLEEDTQPMELDSSLAASEITVGPSESAHAVLSDDQPLPIRNRDGVPGEISLHVFTCDEPGCDQAFAQPHKLKHHQRDHCQEFVCSEPGCGEVFGRMTLLDRHYGEKHAKNADGGKFYCSVDGCEFSKIGGNAFERRHNWQLHMVRMHQTAPEGSLLESSSEG